MTVATCKHLRFAVLGALLFLLGAGGVGDLAWGADLPSRTDRLGAPLPKDALVRVGVTRFRMEGSASSVAFSPDGKLLAGGDSDGLVYLWEAATGKVIRQLDAGEDCSTVFFSQDGKSLGARTAKGEVCLWDVASGKLQTSFQRPTAWNYHEQLLPTPDGKRLIVVSDGNRLINVRNGKYADSYVIGKELPELSIELLELPSGKIVKQLARNAPETVFSDAALSPDGKLLAVGIRAYKAPRKLLRLIDATNGEVVREIKGEGEGWYLSVAFSRDGKTLALGSKDEIALVDLATGNLVDRLTYKMSTIGFLGFSPDAKTLVSHSHDDKVRLWDLATKKVVKEFDAKAAGHSIFPHPVSLGEPTHSEDFGRADGTVLAPNGKIVAVCTSHSVQLWHVAAGKQMFPDEPSADGYNNLAFSPDGSLLLVGDWKHCRLWNSTTGEVRKELPAGAAYAVFSPDGKQVAFARYQSEDEKKAPAVAFIWDIADGKELLRLEHPRNERFGFQMLSFGPDGRTLLTLSTNYSNVAMVHRWDTRTGKPLGSIHRQDTHVWPSVIAADGRTAAIDLGRGVLLTDVQNDEDLWTREDGTPQGWSGYPVFSPDGGFLFGWSENGYVTMCEIATRSLIARLGMCRDGNINMAKGPAQDKDSKKGRETPINQSAIAALAVSPDGRFVATSERFNYRLYDASTTKPVPLPLIRIWEVATGKEVQRLEGFRSAPPKLAFSPDGRRLASAFYNETVLVWDVSRTVRLEPRKKWTPEEMDKLWEDLSLVDGAKAYNAMSALQETPDDAVAFLARHVRPVPTAEATRVQRLVKNLDNDDFTEHEASTKELKTLKAQFRIALIKARKNTVSLEVKTRLETILSEAPRQLPSESLRTLRAIQTLERIGSAEARRIMSVLADGAPDAHETIAAQTALQRLTMRSKNAQ